MRSMRGEFTLKVRSTPTPLAMRRTVIERCGPRPRRRMSVPSNTWIRSRLPSTTLAATRTVSPGASSGRSSRTCSRSICSMTFTGGRAPRRAGSGAWTVGTTRQYSRRSAAAPLLWLGPRARPTARRVLELEIGQELPLTRPRLPAGEQVGPAPRRAAQRLSQSPRLHGPVVARDEDVRDGHAAEHARPGVLRVLEQLVGKGFGLQRGTLDRAREEPQHRVDDDDGGRFAAREHVIPDGDLAVDHLPDPLVHSLVAAAHDHEMSGTGELAGHRLAESLAGRVGQDDRAFGPAQLVDRGGDGLGTHHHPGPSPEGVVVDAAVAPDPPATEVVEAHVGQPF